MQGIGVAISPTGLDSLFTNLIGPQIVSLLSSGLTVPDYTMPPPTPSWTEHGPSGQTESYGDYALNLTDGAFRTFNPTYSGYTQSGDQFVVTLSAPNTVITYTWAETYQRSYFPPPTTTNESFTTSPSDPYVQSFSEFDISVTLALTATGSTYAISYVTSNVTPTYESVSIPSGSILNQDTSGGCMGFGGTVSAATVSQLEAIDFGPNVATAVESICDTIPETGTLTASGTQIVFDFSPSSSGFTFPGAGGIQGGVTGDVTVGGSSYSSTSAPPAGVPIPGIPTGSPAPDITYTAQDYEFDALLWGFSAAGLLDLTLVGNDIADPNALNTRSYASTWPQLYDAYPNQFMTALLTPVSPPTASFQTIYEVTAANLPQIQQALGSAWSTVGSAVEALEGYVYATQDGFETALANSDPPLTDYEAEIETYAQIPGVLVDVDVTCSLDVQNPAPQSNPVLVFDVSGTWAMTSVGLGASASSTAQSITFGFAEPMDVVATATFVSSVVPGATEDTFGFIWAALEEQWQLAMAAAGQQGVPMPRIPGFDFLAENATVTIVPALPGTDGYISVTADAAYVPPS
jgi:hypothetical protein